MIQGYFSLSQENRHKLLLILAREYDLNRTQLRELMKQYVGLEIPHGESSCVTSVHFGFARFGCQDRFDCQVMKVMIMGMKDNYLPFIESKEI